MKMLKVMILIVRLARTSYKCENNKKSDVNSESMKECSCADEKEHNQSKSTQSGDFKRKNKMECPPNIKGNIRRKPYKKIVNNGES